MSDYPKCTYPNCKNKVTIVRAFGQKNMPFCKEHGELYQFIKDILTDACPDSKKVYP